MRFVLDSYGFVKLGKHLDLRICNEVEKFINLLYKHCMNLLRC